MKLKTVLVTIFIIISTNACAEKSTMIQPETGSADTSATFASETKAKGNTASSQNQQGSTSPSTNVSSEAEQAPRSIMFQQQGDSYSGSIQKNDKKERCEYLKQQIEKLKGKPLRRTEMKNRFNEECLGITRPSP